MSAFRVCYNLPTYYMDILEAFKDKELIHLTPEEKTGGKAVILKHIDHNKEIKENIFYRGIHILQGFVTTTALSLRSLWTTQYGNIESIWKKKNDHL